MNTSEKLSENSNFFFARRANRKQNAGDAKRQAAKPATTALSSPPEQERKPHAQTPAQRG
jgi:hypothetical protein